MAAVTRDRVFVRNVMFGVSGSAVREAVARLGFYVLDVQMVRSGQSLQSTSSCIVFLTCSSEEEASRLVLALNGKFLPGVSSRALMTELAVPRMSRLRQAFGSFSMPQCHSVCVCVFV